MDARMQVEVSIPQTLFEQAERLARRLGLSQAALFERALEDFICDQFCAPMNRSALLFCPDVGSSNASSQG